MNKKEGRERGRKKEGARESHRSNRHPEAGRRASQLVSGPIHLGSSSWFLGPHKRETVWKPSAPGPRAPNRPLKIEEHAPAPHWWLPRASLRILAAQAFCTLPAHSPDQKGHGCRDQTWSQEGERKGGQGRQLKAEPTGNAAVCPLKPFPITLVKVLSKPEGSTESSSAS